MRGSLESPLSLAPGKKKEFIMEEDFPFTFGNVSDEDEGSEGLFCPPKAKSTSAKTRAPVEQEPYYAQIDEDGWFHRTGKSVKELMQQDKNGATKIKMRADHYYMLRQYQEAYDTAQEYCRVIAANEQSSASSTDGGTRPQAGLDGAGVLKVTDSKEMQEMALRCALKLGKLGEAAALADDLTLQDTGAVFLKAQAFMAVERYNDAALRLVQYQKTRSSNYSIWRTLAECLHQATKPAAQHLSSKSGSAKARAFLPASSLSYSESRMMTALALISILRARHLMRASTWSQVDFAKARFDREMTIMDSLRSDFEQECGVVCGAIADQIQGTDLMCEEAELQSRILEYENKVLAPVRDVLLQMKETSGQLTEQAGCTIALEVVDFVVSSWDPQVLASSVSGNVVEDDHDPGEVNVRNK